MTTKIYIFCLSNDTTMSFLMTARAIQHNATSSLYELYFVISLDTLSHGTKEIRTLKKMFTEFDTRLQQSTNI